MRISLILSSSGKCWTGDSNSVSVILGPTGIDFLSTRDAHRHGAKCNVLQMASGRPIASRRSQGGKVRQVVGISRDVAQNRFRRDGIHRDQHRNGSLQSAAKTDKRRAIQLTDLNQLAPLSVRDSILPSFVNRRCWLSD